MDEQGKKVTGDKYMSSVDKYIRENKLNEYREYA